MVVDVASVIKVWGLEEGLGDCRVGADHHPHHQNRANHQGGEAGGGGGGERELEVHPRVLVLHHCR